MMEEAAEVRRKMEEVRWKMEECKLK